MSGKDFYKILGVDKKASDAEIKKAYKKLALKWHPDRVPQDKKDEAQAKFQEIGEAFDVLSDPEKRRMYDAGGGMPFNGEFSETGMPGSGGFGPGPQFHFSSSQSGGPGGQSFHFGNTNADEIFKRFFGTSDPFAAGGDDDHPFGGGGGGPGFMFGSIPGMNGGMSMGGMPGGMPGGMSMNMGGMQGGAQAPSRQAEPVIYPLNVSLEELYHGISKRVRITAKKLVNGASGRTQSVSSEKEIKLKPGWKDGTKITFAGEGDQQPGVKPADIIFIIKSKPHDRFRRSGDDLIYDCPITLEEALCGFCKTVQTLDGRELRIEASHATPETVKIIPAEGMPNSKTQRKGDLRINFKIRFPTLSASQRSEIARVFRSGSS